MDVYGVIEGGGSKFICAVGTETKLIEESMFQTVNPQQTMAEVVEFFKTYQANYGNLKSIAIGTFGPIIVDHTAKNYGEILQTSNKAWRGFNMYQFVRGAINVPVFVDTDVNMAAMGEGYRGQCKGLKNYAYITIGTNVSVGAVIDKKPLHGLLHSEAGHIHLKRKEGDDYEGLCAFHGDCMEGLCSGAAIEDRSGVPPINIPADHETWDYVAYYIAQFIVNITLTLATEKIVLGGGILKQKTLLEKVRKYFKELLNDYIFIDKLTQPGSEYIVVSTLKPSAAIIGGIFIGKAINKPKT